MVNSSTVTPESWSEFLTKKVLRPVLWATPHVLEESMERRTWRSVRPTGHRPSRRLLLLSTPGRDRTLRGARDVRACTGRN